MKQQNQGCAQDEIAHHKTASQSKITKCNLYKTGHTKKANTANQPRNETPINGYKTPLVTTYELPKCQTNFTKQLQPYIRELVHPLNQEALYL
jgi:hypothetical protein